MRLVKPHLFCVERWAKVVRGLRHRTLQQIEVFGRKRIKELVLASGEANLLLLRAGYDVEPE